MTPRIRLCRLARSDRDEFVAAMRASRELHGRWATPPTTGEGFDALFERRSADEGAEFLLVRRREDDALVGYFDLSQIIRGPFQNAFLGYAGVSAHSGQGYMAVGMALLLRHAVTDLRLHRLEADIQPGNSASIALVRPAGFVSEGFSERYLKLGGRWRDHERWAIRAEQWREHRVR